MANLKTLAKTIGPGLIFASTAIGTSHLVLSTRAGAHYGMVVFWVIVGALIIKYPFYEYGPRYASATGYSLLKGYRDQGKWAVVLFMIVIGINMFAVVAAVGAVSAGLLSTTFGLSGIPIPVLMGSLLFITALILLIGRYAGLDYFVKLISAVLLVTVTTAFIAVLLKGPIEPINGFIKAPLFKGVGLTLMISLIGWMPNGMEASTMHSIWTIKKSQATGHKPNLKESLFDFNLGYLFTVLLALMFLVIGAFSAYGSGQLFDNGATKFSNQLLVILTQNIGQWSYLFVAIAAFGTIYGTLIAAWDAFTRSFIRGLRVFKFDSFDEDEAQTAFLRRGYNMLLPLIGIGGFALFYFSAASMIKILETATIIGFITSPLICILNLRSILSKDIPESHQVSKLKIWFSYVGIVLMISFAIYYIYHVIVAGAGH